MILVQRRTRPIHPLLLAVVLFQLLPAECLAAERPGPAIHNSAMSAAPARFRNEAKPLLARYCVNCHDQARSKGNLVLDKYDSIASIQSARLVWQSVADNIEAKSMPPEEAKNKPTDAERTLLVGLINDALAYFDPAAPRSPAFVPIHRLNRTEYNNTVRDLTGVDFQPARDFPADDTGYGFDNIADVLSMSPLLIEKYLAAAEQIIARIPGTEKNVFFIAPSKDVPEESAARQIIRRFAIRAYRRPVAMDDTAALMRIYTQARQDGDSFDSAVRLALTAVLVSPQFLFRIERDPTGSSRPHLLSEYELASRLSYFLWSTMPDDLLIAAAGKSRLRADLDQHVRRMLADPRSSALVSNFAGQWLELRNLDEHSPDPSLFPDFTTALRDDMKRETELFIENLIREDRPVTDLLTADYSFLNERLARHYGISGVAGKEFRRVSLAGTPRAGIITQGAILTLTAMPARTSAVKRGKYVLEEILGSPPPPPPANVPQLPDKPRDNAAASLRDRLLIHREDPTCASCHVRMDAIGFSLENFDAIGRWRTRDGAFDIDSVGVLSGGRRIDGAAGLRQYLLSRRQDVVHCFIEKLLIYALGRGPELSDRPYVHDILAAGEQDDYRFSSIIVAVIGSDLFQKRAPANQYKAPSGK